MVPVGGLRPLPLAQAGSVASIAPRLCGMIMLPWPRHSPIVVTTLNIARSAFRLAVGDGARAVSTVCLVAKPQRAGRG